MYSPIIKALTNKGYHVTSPINKYWTIRRTDDKNWQLTCRNLKQAYEMINYLHK